MASRSTEFPDAPETKAFRAVEAILRADPDLIANGVKFRSWNGDRADNQPIASGDSPLLRISPEIVAPDSPKTMGLNEAHFAVKVELFVKGFIADDIVNFWGVVRNAMVRTKPFLGKNVQCYLTTEANVSRSWVSAPGFGSWQSKELPDNGLAGVGRINLLILVPA